MMRSMILACAICALGAVSCVATSSASNETAVTQNIDCIPQYDCANLIGPALVRCLAMCISVQVFVIDIGGGCPQCRILKEFELNELTEDLNNSAGDVNILNIHQAINSAEATVLDDYLNKFNIQLSNNNIETCAPTIGFCT
jgi:hypothetical protein